MTKIKIIKRVFSNLGKKISPIIKVIIPYSLAGGIFAGLAYMFGVSTDGIIVTGIVGPLAIGSVLFLGYVFYQDAKDQIEKEERELLNTLKRNHYYD